MKVKIAILAILVILVGILIIMPWGKNPGKASEYLSKGRFFFQQGKIDEAIAAYEKGVTYNPDSAEGYNLLGVAYRFKFNRKKDEKFRSKEIGAFKKSIALDPNNWYPYINLGVTLFHKGNKKEAAGFLKKGLELNPQNIEANKIREMIDEAEKEN